MYRPAKSFDAIELVEVVKERHPDTRYAGVGIDEQIARRTFAQAVQRHGHEFEGGTFLLVADDGERIHGFMLGMLSRVYFFGTSLVAHDVMLLGRRDCSPRSLLELFDHYVAWASSNPNVIEIGASWADSIPGSEGITKAYERRGFELSAKTYRLLKGQN